MAQINEKTKKILEKRIRYISIIIKNLYYKTKRDQREEKKNVNIPYSNLDKLEKMIKKV